MQPPPPPPMPSGSQPVYYPAGNIAYVEHARGPEYKSPQSTFVVFSLNVAHNLTQICLGGVIISSLDIAYYVSPIWSAMKNHIILCTIGYFILIAQAILSFSPVGWANNLKHEHKRIVHAVMQTVGSILAVAGCLVALIDSGFILNSAHGICGFIAMILTIISFIAGVFNFKFCQQAKTKLFQILHSSLGTMTMLVVFISLILLYHSLEFSNKFLLSNTVFACVGTLLMAVVNIYKQIFGKTANNMS